MDRTILHCDCNSFFASVETLLAPSLADGPTAVCGDPESRHGIILAKNEKAKAFGVQTAETIWQAKRKCPDLRLVAPHRSEYVKFSRKCNELYLQYTDLVDKENHGNLRALMDFKYAKNPVPIEEVESVDEIVKHFKTGAMSYGSISQELMKLLPLP